MLTIRSFCVGPIIFIGAVSSFDIVLRTNIVIPKKLMSGIIDNLTLSWFKNYFKKINIINVAVTYFFPMEIKNQTTVSFQLFIFWNFDTFLIFSLLKPHKESDNYRRLGKFLVDGSFYNAITSKSNLAFPVEKRQLWDNCKLLNFLLTVNKNVKSTSNRYCSVESSKKFQEIIINVLSCNNL